MMTIEELVEKLQEIAEEHGEDTEILIQIGCEQQYAERVRYAPETEEEWAAAIIK